MTREEARNLVDEFAEFSIIDYQRKYHVSAFDAMNKRNELKQKIYDALSSPATPSTPKLSFEEFSNKAYDAVHLQAMGEGNLELRALYDRMTNHSEDKLEMVETQQKLTNSLDFETFKQALDTCWDCGVAIEGFSQGDETQCDNEHCPAFKKLHVAIAKKSIESGEGFTFYIPERVDWKAIKPTGFLKVSISPREKCSKFKAVEVKP